MFMYSMYRFIRHYCVCLLQGVDLTQREKALTLYSRNKKKSMGEVMIKVNLVGEEVCIVCIYLLCVKLVYMCNYL